MMQNIDESELIKLLSKFECDKDEDIQNFITNKEKAIQYERLQKARTYILFDENQIKEETIENLDILGYISLATKVLSVPDEVSNRFRKEIDGLSAKIHGQRINEFSTYLIGQLGRNSRFKSEELPGKVLLDYADSVISVAMNSVGGRATLIECKNDSKLINFYSENGFKIVGNEPDENSELMIQMIRIKN
jgi:hypothetical protein